MNINNNNDANNNNLNDNENKNTNTGGRRKRKKRAITVEEDIENIRNFIKYPSDELALARKAMKMFADDVLDHVFNGNQS